MRIKKKTSIISILIGLILASSMSRSSATLVWEEAFENPPFDDWFLYSYNTSLYPSGPYLADDYPPIIANGILQMQQSKMMQACALHYSSVAYGTWSFDFHIPEDNDSVSGILFIGNNYGGGNLNLSGKTYAEISSTMVAYIIYIKSGTEGGSWLSSNSITFKIWTPTKYETIGEHKFSSYLSGFHNMTITRNSTQGEFNVNLDSNRIFQVTNNEIKTSEVLELTSFYGEISFDNLTVCDSVGTPCTTTTTTITTTTTTTTQDTTPTPATTTSSNGTFGFEFGVLILVLVFSVFAVRKRKR